MQFSELFREVTRRVPYRFGATLINVAMSALGREGTAGWMVSQGPRGLPQMVVNPALPFQRRMYFFPRAYWDRLMGLPFGRFVERELRAGDVFLDIGSNVGFYTLFASQRVGATGIVHAFEPEPSTFESLRRSVEANGFSWTTCHNLALSDREGVLPFHFVADGSAHSLVVETKERTGRYAGSVEVRVATLDGLVSAKQLELPRIDLVKIDVEGEEVRTVRGMLQTLRQTGLPPVWAEVRGPKGSTRAPNTYRDVREALSGLGYEPYFWTPGRMTPVAPDAVQQREDVLFVHPSRRIRCEA